MRTCGHVWSTWHGGWDDSGDTSVEFGASASRAQIAILATVNRGSVAGHELGPCDKL